jgi:hypothetical protein
MMAASGDKTLVYHALSHHTKGRPIYQYISHVFFVYIPTLYHHPCLTNIDQNISRYEHLHHLI